MIQNGQGPNTAGPPSQGLLALGAVMLFGALLPSGGTLHLPALGLATGAAACALVGAMGLAGARRLRAMRAMAPAAITVGLGGSLLLGFASVPGMYVDPERLGPYRILLGIAGLLAASYAWTGIPPWVRRLRWMAFVAVGGGLGATVILGSPAPPIDVWVIRQLGAQALSEGVNPYSVGYPNIYGAGSPFLARSMLSADGRWILAYPYMPLTLLVDLPFRALGDVRWGTLAALVAAALLVSRLGEGSRTSELGAALLLVNPATFFVLEQAWTEPLLLSLLLTTAVGVVHARTASGWGPWALPVLGAAAAIGCKQYAPVFLLPIVATVPARVRWRVAFATGLVAALLMLPFVAWDSRSFLRGIFEFQVAQPFRLDALSWAAAIAVSGGPRIPSWVGFLAAGGILLVVLRRETSLAGAIAIGACSWLVLVLVSKQAFANYYWIAAGLLLGATALAGGNDLAEGRG